MRYCSISSGSKGNCHLIQSEKQTILVDAGGTAKQLACRLASLDVSLAEVNAVLITHEHIDHIAALDVLSRQCGMKIYANRATAQAIMRRFPKIAPERFCYFETGESFYIGELDIMPFAISHDAAEPVGYTVYRGLKKITIATDIGYMTRSVLEQCRDSHLLVLEANHDEQMLRSGPYPPSLQRRILGNKGHLSNKSCGETVSALAGGEIRRLILGHLSQENNTPQLALDTVRAALSEKGVPLNDLPIDVAMQDRRGICYDITRL